MIESNEVIWPKLTFPKPEADLVRKHYGIANVILEYGSGGSTVLAAKLPKKFILSVESDKAWARSLQLSLDVSEGISSRAIVYHADIGATGRWGRPVNSVEWKKFHRYPLSIWSQPFFRSPDVVLIDGRFRPACFLATCLFTRQPVTVLFDDYKDRQSYHVVEQFIEPAQMVGRMAVFHLEPRSWPSRAYQALISCCNEATFSSDPQSEHSRFYSETSVLYY